ncbi:hypothetical protein BG015_004122 [Linnemannia schmuckeri]|uniref:Uncharacterized protein n=1 Tax=Linnemannia schmuckeri TaxID=64567 RepID=A0A9P5S5I8_9FUNG|nr:hypothetical protein BG015_004122 [Linnemannia schmuckeri]
MDQEIEAQAKEFLAFQEQCSQQPRAKATSEINASLNHLQTFLTTIQPIIEPWPITNEPTIESMPVHASELYPTLGPLLEMLCRNPVVTASTSFRGLADLVAQSVIKFSARAGGNVAVVGARSNSATTPIPPPPSAEQSWRAARMRDMFRAQQQQGELSRKKNSAEGHPPCSGQNESVEKKRDPFQGLFEVSGKELKEREMEQTLETMVDNLTMLLDQVANTELTDTAWFSLVTWNRQLSELCAPLVSTPSAAKLLGGIIRAAYVLYSKRLQGPKLVPLHLLDSSFVESLMMQQTNATMPAILKDHQTLAQLLIVSSLARQRSLIQLIDGVIQDYERSPDFYQSRHQITQRHFESSQFLTSALSGQLLEDQRRHLAERILEDSAELAGEIDDWRIVRIWILLVEWALTRLGSGESVYMTPMESDASFPDHDVNLCAVILTAGRIVNYRESEPKEAASSRVSISAAVLLEIDTLWKIQVRYIFQTAPPQEMALRRRIVFLIGCAVTSSNGLLSTLIHQHILSLDKSDRHQKQDSPTISQNTITLLNLISLLTSGELNIDSSSTIGQPFLALLQELHAALHVSKASNPYDLRMGTVADLEGIFTKFVSLLRINMVVTADIVYQYGSSDNHWLGIGTITDILAGVHGSIAGSFRDTSSAWSRHGIEDSFGNTSYVSNSDSSSS